MRIQTMIGKQILHYKIVEKLGQGGMGAVYKAEDTKLERTVALKFLPPNALGDKDDVARFVHEAQAAAALHHPNICTVFEINEADDQVFISMAYLPGDSLRDRIRSGPLTTKDTLRIAIDITKGLEAAHGKGIVHRDIKPTNIMFSETGAATVMDFGLAKSKKQTHVTRLGTTMGTIAYMSPEQTRGDDVDHRTDIWSLGVMLYEMTSGQRPFRGDYDEAVIYSILNEAPKPIDEIQKNADPNLIHIIEKAMAKKSADRYQSAEEMLTDLELLFDEVKSGSTKTRSATFSRLGVPGPPTGARGILRPRILFPATVVVGAFIVVLFLVFSGDRGTVTETVAVKDEQGRTIERTVPKSEYRKSFALYFYDNKTGDPKNDWIGTAIATMLQIDLLQDQILSFSTPFEGYAVDRLQRAGFTSWNEAPWSLKLQIAKDSHREHLVTGSYVIENGDYVVTQTLHNTATGRLMAQKTYRGGDLFALVDEMSVGLKMDLDVPDSYIEDLKDLPVAEMVTASSEALEAFSVGLYRWAFEQQWQEGTESLEKAVEIDSTFAFAHFQLIVLYLNSNRSEKVDHALQAVMRYLYRLPERFQFIVKSVYYALKQDPGKQLAVLKMMTELYPEDVIGRQMLAAGLTNANRSDEAIEQYEEILEIDPGRSEVLQTIGGLYKDKGEYESALEYYETYANKYPKDVSSFAEIASIYKNLGEFEKATQYYDRALLIEPENVMVLRSLAGIDERQGRAEDALRKYNEALAVSKAPQDRMEVYASLQSFYSNRGQMETSFEYMDLKLNEQESVQTPIQALIDRMMDGRFYVRADRTDEAFKIVESISRQMQPPYDGVAPLGYVYLYLEIDEADSAEVALAGLMPFIEAYGLEKLRHMVYWAEGRIAEIREDYDKAIESFQKQAELVPDRAVVHHNIGRCYRKLGEYENAETSLSRFLKVFPTDPDALYELALVFAERGEQSKAIETLEKALTVWEDADPVYEPAQKARAKLAEWMS